MWDLLVKLSLICCTFTLLSNPQTKKVKPKSTTCKKIGRIIPYLITLTNTKGKERYIHPREKPKLKVKKDEVGLSYYKKYRKEYIYICKLQSSSNQS